MGEKTTFSVEVNGHRRTTVVLSTGIYRAAAAALPALLGIDDFPVRVRIWVEHLQPDYPPLEYQIDEPGGAAQQVLDLTRVSEHPLALSHEIR